MDIEKLIEQLNGYFEGKDLKRGVALDTATALSTLRAENEKLRDEVERQRRSADDRQHLYENAERAYMKVLAELEQMKKIMRENGIMIIPSKYPGGKAEWNIPKP